ncbi:MAG: nucleotidyltransferase domain-containing protein [Candidatus Poribacteria bacterium]|nr:nucleotidyltransferase domain-containing protein [Candidatus Poribacteria bacterium]
MTIRELDQRTLDEIIRRVVEVAQPERIILFGSAVRSTMTPNSDVDLLIVKEGGDAKNLSFCRLGRAELMKRMNYEA